MIATVKTIEKRKEIINKIIPYLALTGLMLALLFLPMEKGNFSVPKGTGTASTRERQKP